MVLEKDRKVGSKVYSFLYSEDIFKKKKITFPYRSPVINFYIFFFFWLEEVLMLLRFPSSRAFLSARLGLHALQVGQLHNFTGVLSGAKRRFGVISPLADQEQSWSDGSWG